MSSAMVKERPTNKQGKQPAEDPKQTVFESVVAAFVGCFFVGFDALVPAVTFKSSEVIKQPVHKHIFYWLASSASNQGLQHASRAHGDGICMWCSREAREAAVR